MILSQVVCSVFRPTIAALLLFPIAGCRPPSVELKARETILRQDLHTMRQMVHQYAVDQKALPSSIDDLVRKGYMREVPIDPITGKADWDVDIGTSSMGITISSGVIDVHSHAQGKDSDGIRYRDY